MNFSFFIALKTKKQCLENLKILNRGENMARCPRCGSEAIEEINPNTYKCHECGYMIRNPDYLDLADQEYGY